MDKMESKTLSYYWSSSFHQYSTVNLIFGRVYPRNYSFILKNSHGLKTNMWGKEGQDEADTLKSKIA